jgi:hypothetical protein
MRPLTGAIPLIRTLLVLSFLAAVPELSSAREAQSTPALPAQWNDAVETLAGKISTVAGRSKAVSLVVKNVSSLKSSEAAAIRQRLEDDLIERGFHVEKDSSAETTVTLTLSESAHAYVWVAEWPAGDTRRVELVSAPKIEDLSGHRSGASLTLGNKLIWQQPGKFIDFAVVTTGGPDSMLIVLEPDRLAYYHSGDLLSWQFSRSVPISHSSAWPLWARDARGFIDLRNDSGFLPGIVCRQILDPEKTRCDFQDQKPVFPGQGLSLPGREENETALLAERCGDDRVALSTGHGDWTQPDSIQGYLLAGLADARPSGAPIQLEGPVISLIADTDQGSARVVVRNLKTGNYEAYVVTTNCGH